MENNNHRRAVHTESLTNFLSFDKKLFDTLHDVAIKEVNPCERGVCTGSVVQPKGTICHYSAGKSVDLDELRDFFRQFFESSKMSQNEHDQRLEEVLSSVKENGYYEKTIKELDFACKTAWRNASRCIGRIQWSKLKLYDGRELTSTKAMFDLICEHLEFATNGGSLRSAITVFPCRQSGKHCRIWNVEYISYAGFQVSPGKVVGDAANVEFTNICLRLGWKPKVDRFTVLPLVLQCGEENPVLFEIPDSLVLEVPITHPKYKKLADLNLKWFALPAVSNMALDAGGQLYTASGFNGWYMSTEIVRDLCDNHRYNMLKEIAESMDMDTTKPDMFWKDLAATELNIAIVTSYQALNITITDHHTASETFMHHMENEQMARGGCPADWVWIIPPLGGALTQVFHQEMLNYKLKPSYEYQAKPWIGFKWKGDMRKGNIRETRLTLRSVGRAIVVCYKLMKSALKERKHCTILYATETGKSERFAYQLQRQFDQDFQVEIFCMDKYDQSRLKDESLLLVVTSTFGNGEAPDNGLSFEEFLQNLCERKNQSLWTVVPRFAVFGLGSSAYPNYCSFSVRVDEMLANIGVKRLLDIHTGDEQHNQDIAFREWSSKIFKKACQYFGVNLRRTMSGVLTSSGEKTTKYKLLPSDQKILPCKGLQKIHKKPVISCSAEYVRSLVSPKANDETILVSLKHEDLAYEPGDHLAVFPPNTEENVRRLCESCTFDEGVTADTPVVVDKQMDCDSVKHGAPDRVLSRLPVTSLAVALTHYLDIEARPTPTDIEALLTVCQCDEDDKKKLLVMSMNPNEYNKWAEFAPSWVDLVKEFPSVRIPASFLLTELDLLQPRFYSISNSQLCDPKEVHMTVAVLKYTVGPEGTKQKFGLCTNYLHKLKMGDLVNAFVRKCPNFHLPSPSEDVIMVGAGSGMAPYRSFWQEREALLEQGSLCAGRMYVFQGFKSRAVALHQQEINKAIADRVVEARFTAFSREKHIEKTYIQDKLREHIDLVYNLLVKGKAHVYVCGDIKMAVGVAEAVKSVLASKSQMNEKKKEQEFNALKQEGRYHEDIYSILV